MLKDDDYQKNLIGDHFCEDAYRRDDIFPKPTRNSNAYVMMTKVSFQFHLLFKAK